MMKLLIDTNILVDYLRGLPSAVQFIEQSLEATECYISSITVSELFAGVREGQEKKILCAFLDLFSCVDVDRAVAEQGGLYCRSYAKSHNVGLADAIIAASAESVSAKLVSLNKKHFPMLKEISVPY